MATLNTDIRATLINGKTGQQIEDATLEAGTTYTLENVRTSVSGQPVAAILAGGYWYETYDLAAVEDRA